MAVFSLVTLAGCVLAYLASRDDSEHSAPARCGARQDPQTREEGSSMVRQKKAPAARRRPMSREEALARQERQQRRRELEQESRELAKGPLTCPSSSW